MFSLLTCYFESKVEIGQICIKPRDIDADFLCIFRWRVPYAGNGLFKLQCLSVFYIVEEIFLFLNIGKIS